MVTTVEPGVGHGSAMRERANRYLPILSWGRAYRRDWWGRDAISGLTLWGLVVPEAMAYAGIAGPAAPSGSVHPRGLNADLRAAGDVATPVVGGTSAAAALLASSVAASWWWGINAGSAHVPDVRGRIRARGGPRFLVASLARLGYITQFLSKPVMDGSVVGLAIFVAVGQLHKLVGVPSQTGNGREALEILRQLPDANGVAFVVGVARARPALPVAPGEPEAAGRVRGALRRRRLSSLLDLAGKHGVAVVGELPQGLPPRRVHGRCRSGDYLAMVLPAIGVVLVAFSESLGMAKEFADKHGYEVDANQELDAHAAVNLGRALFGGMISGGSMSASAVKEAAGARTQVANLVTWLATLVTFLFLTPIFASLPEAVFAALIIHAVWHIIAVARLIKAADEAPVEVWFGVLRMAGVLLIDVSRACSSAYWRRSSSSSTGRAGPHVAPFGRVPGGGLLRRCPPPREQPGAGNADRAPRRAVLLCQRPDGSRPGAQTRGRH